jgi:hypothetical protein
MGTSKTKEAADGAGRVPDVVQIALYCAAFMLPEQLDAGIDRRADEHRAKRHRQRVLPCSAIGLLLMAEQGVVVAGWLGGGDGAAEVFPPRPG